MSSKKLSQIIKKEILLEECDYEYIYGCLNDNLEETMSGILNSFKTLFKNINDEFYQEKFNTLVNLISKYIKKNKNKKDLEVLYDKIDVFLDNLSKSFNANEIFELEKYISIVIDIQNKCLLRPLKKGHSEKYNFMIYLIFESKNIELLSKYIIDNMKELLISNTVLSSVFATVIEKYINTEDYNEIEINYYDQVINLFLKGKLYNKLMQDDRNNFIKILKTSDKKHVIKLVERIENDLLIEDGELAKQYNVSFEFPDDLEEFKYTDEGMVDFTNQNIITIDNEFDKCLDDALYIEKNEDGTYKLYIHLANPTSIIPYYSNTMKEALRRNKTIYLEDREITIFEDYLANNILSILPEKKTNTMTFIIDIDTDYTIMLDNIKVVEGVVINRNKLSYEKVDSILRKANDDELTKQLVLLSEVCSKLSSAQIQMLNYHKLENTIRGTHNTNSAKSDTSYSHSIVENSMVFVNRLPDIINKYYNLDLVLPYRVQTKFTEEDVTSILSNIKNINPNSRAFRNIVKNHLMVSKYSIVNTGHIGLGVDGYVRVGSSARRAMDDLALYVIKDLYINRDKGDLDIKYDFWNEEVDYWCKYANIKSYENDNFSEQYNYLLAKGKILKK